MGKLVFDEVGPEAEDFIKNRPGGCPEPLSILHA